ncbi:hypothetical protein OJ928_04260 [Streptococcus anginosus]|nr:hypothetical protein [Streptococcus anginosus]
MEKRTEEVLERSKENLLEASSECFKKEFMGDDQAECFIFVVIYFSSCWQSDFPFDLSFTFCKERAETI